MDETRREDKNGKEEERGEIRGGKRGNETRRDETRQEETRQEEKRRNEKKRKDMRRHERRRKLQDNVKQDTRQKTNEKERICVRGGKSQREDRGQSAQRHDDT